MRMRPLVIAHRGGAGEATENSLAAFRRAAALGVDGIETDLRATSDGLVVLHHDAELVLRDGRIIPISAMEGEELLVARPDVPTLAAALAAVHGDFFWLLELKPVSHSTALLGGLQRVLRHQKARCVLASFSAALLRQAAAAVPGVPLAAVVEHADELPAFSGLSLKAIVAKSECAAELARAEAQSATTAREIWAWTTSTPAEARTLFTAGVAGLICDTPRGTLHAFGSSISAES